MIAPFVKFGEVFARVDRRLELHNDEEYDCVGVRWYGQGAFVRERLTGVQIKRKQQWRIQEGDIVYNKLFAWKGSFAVADELVDGCIVSDKFPTYHADSNRIDVSYLKWFFKTEQIARQAEKLSKGAAAISKLTLNPPQFWDLQIPLPPLADQRRIVAKIERLARRIGEAISLRRALVDGADALFLSRLSSLLGELSVRFQSRTLISLCDAARGISYGIVQTGKPFDGGVPTLRAGDLAWFNVLASDVKRVDPSIEEKYRRTRLSGNELLLRIRGGLGEVAVCPAEMVGGNVSREIAVIPLLPGILPEYAMYALAAPSSQDFLHRHLRGTSYVGINLKDVRRAADRRSTRRLRYAKMTATIAAMPWTVLIQSIVPADPRQLATPSGR